jgi:hypothetical protein
MPCGRDGGPLYSRSALTRRSFPIFTDLEVQKRKSSIGALLLQGDLDADTHQVQARPD